MDRKAIARQTLDIMEKGWYETEGTVVEIRARQQESVKKSVLFTPEQGERLLEQYETVTKKTAKYKCCTWNCSTVDANGGMRITTSPIGRQISPCSRARIATLAPTASFGRYAS